MLMPTILIVDDDQGIRDLLRNALEHAGYQVVDAASGKAGIESYRSAPTDLVIMDILMPGQDGLESIRCLRSEFPDVKIIAMTGGCEQLGAMSILDMTLMLGARRTFSKPFEVPVVLQAVQEELHTP